MSKEVKKESFVCPTIEGSSFYGKFEVHGREIVFTIEFVGVNGTIRANECRCVSRDLMQWRWDFSNSGTAFLDFKSQSSKNGLSVWSYDFGLEADAAIDVVVHLKMGFLSKDRPYFQIPASLYGDCTLADSRSIQPQLIYRSKGEYPQTDRIHTRADRSSHRAVLVREGEHCFALQVDEVIECETFPQGYLENGLSVSADEKDRYDFIGVSLGYQQFPRLYRGKLGDASTSESETFEGVSFEPGQRMVSRGRFYCASSEEPDWLLEQVSRELYYSIHESPKNRIDRNEAIVSMATAIANDAYLKEYHYFPTVLSGDRPDTGSSGDVAWTGGVQVVYPLLRSWQRVPEAADVAIDFVTHLLDSGVSTATGMFYESKCKEEWSLKGWWTELIAKHHPDIVPESGVHSAYINGQACCYLLKMISYAKDKEVDGFQSELIEKCRNRVFSILSHVLDTQREDGAYGIYFDGNDGRALLHDGCQGLWFLAAIAEAYRMTRESKWLLSFDRANEFYYGYLKVGCLWGMPMDTGDAPDEECALPYATAMATMHQSLARSEDLETLLHVLNYDFSWKFAYNTRHRNEPLRSMNWCSSGGCVTSSHNIHIHQMGNLIAEEIYYAYQQTGDEYYKDRLVDTLNWGLGTFNHYDQHFGFGKTGWATEQFFHSDGVQDDPTRIPNGGIWPDFLCWASSCVLLSCNSDIPDKYFTPEKK